MFRISLDSTDWMVEVYESSYREGQGTIEIRDGEDGKWLGSLHGEAEDIERLRAACDALLSEMGAEQALGVRKAV